MYKYTEFDSAFVRARIAEFRSQVERRIEGGLTEDEFKPLRLMNGLYLQLHAYMLRVAIPYGTLNSAQMRQLAMIAERWDKGYGHFTTRQNIQFNWPKLADVPDILEALADVEMHAIQTSGNCIRNVTADHFAGAVAGEVEDPRLTAELIRQWSTDHPEFAYLPRKFKVAVIGSDADRAVLRFHDIGLQVVREGGEIGYRVVIGGGLGRTPMIGKVVREFLPKRDLLAYLEAILRTYNMSGRRDNKYKARIKILVHETGLEVLKDRIEAHFEAQKRVLPDVNPAVRARIAEGFVAPALSERPAAALSMSPALRAFVDTNVTAHRDANHVIVTVSTKGIGTTPGDVSAAQMRVLADLAERYSHDELRISHEQNVILPHVHRDDLPAVHAALLAADLATANIGLISDIIACPGMDYCALATARSIPIAQQIGEAFADLDAQHDIGPLKIKISGCINACGHHHVGHIGILGLDRAGVENYQLTLGGDGTQEATLGTRTGPGFSYSEIVPAVERLIEAYLDLRQSREESFLDAYRRVGIAPFKAALYEDRDAKAA
ncbi:nitrite/sulfite reductase [Rhodalgimonas zhirmunskyi]|uniref:Nitrite/sulfite reductase n=1 Tax=Rhodalgimonas zhirmunskyi TaxID=2964767 RepID=A0AAJ1U5A6_9RHOB|nr:nitrite/sulfite reductase [Rhodoalgimonas zhirmunskyi]MDQ2093410.1 nitrite/sulfite reductase [Rhodoalgimonas zhirmunskyi]